MFYIEGMAMKKFLLSTLLFATLIDTPATHAISSFDSISSTVADLSPFAKVGTGALAVAAGYTASILAYNSYQQYVENKIINETVEALFLSITLNSTIKKLPKTEREEAFRKKARLINLRKRIIARLEDVITNETLSAEHTAALNQNLQKALKAFALIDKIRNENPYEQEYAVASQLDQMIENNLINSILLRFKPDTECTQQERAKKQELTNRRSIIKQKLQDKIANVWSANIMQMLIITQLVVILGKSY